MRGRPGAIGLVLALAAAGAAAQGGFPVRPLRLVVPFAPGGYTDIVARIVGPRLAEGLGQPILIENRSGSGGNLGAEAVARAAPDGHTFMVAAPPIAISPSLYGAKLNYDPRALAPVAMLADFPNALVVDAARGPADVRELIERARARPGALNYASNGAGTSTHLTSELFKMHTRTFIVHIPYRGAPAAAQAVMMGDAAFYFNNIAPALPNIRAGRFRALAVTSATRSPLLPDVPTMAEVGLPGVEVSAFLGFMATAGAPDAALARLEAELRRVVALPEIVTALERQGGFVQFRDRRAFGEFLAAETAKWAAAVKFSGATPE